MIFEYEVILPSSIENPEFIIETVNSIVAELSESDTHWAGVDLGENYNNLQWKSSPGVSDIENLVSTKMLPGGGALACFNTEEGRPYYRWLTDEVIQNISEIYNGGFFRRSSTILETIDGGSFQDRTIREYYIAGTF